MSPSVERIPWWLLSAALFLVLGIGAATLGEQVRRPPGDLWRAYDFHREQMVVQAVEFRSYLDPGLLHALRAVPRHRFLPVEDHPAAYGDVTLPVTGGWMLAPSVLAAMVTEARVQGGEDVLLVGTPSGYEAAVLAEMGARVDAVETDPMAAADARRRLRGLRYGDRVAVLDRLPQDGRYDVIMLTAPAPPEALVARLKVGGRLLMPRAVGSGREQMWLHVRDARDGTTERAGPTWQLVPSPVPD